MVSRLITISRVRSIGGDGGVVDTLVSAAMDVLVWAANDPDEVSRAVREPGLRRAMTFAEKASKHEGNVAVEVDRGRRLGAAAALMLIQNSADIFKSYPVVPEPIGLLRKTGYLSGAACQLAISVASRYAAESAPLKSVDSLVAFSQLAGPMEGVIAAGKGARGWWETSFPVITAALRELDDAPPGDRPVEQTVPDGPQVPDVDQGIILGEQGPAPDPDEGDPSTRKDDDLAEPARQRWMIRRWLAVLAAVVVLAAVQLFPLIPSVTPRALFGSQDSVSSDPSKLVVIPPMPPPIGAVQSPDALPNTTIRLFLMSDGSNPVPANQTMNGVLPTVSAAVVPAVSESVTFRVWLSVTNVDAPPDRDLKMSIQATNPMVVEKSMLMSDETHAGPSKPELNSVIDTKHNFAVSGGGYTDVGPLPAIVGAKVVYQFTVKARPSETDNGYVCGYNPKSVQVNVQIGGDDSRKAVTTPYPLYVVRGVNC